MLNNLKTTSWMILLALLFGCTMENSEPTQNTVNIALNPVIITFAAPESKRSTYNALITRFNADNPDLRVQFVASPSDNNLRQIVTAADTAAVTFSNPNDVNFEYLYNLSPFISSDAVFDVHDVYPAALSLFTHEQNVYALPYGLRIPMLAYNKDLWASRELAPPQVNWQWNDVLVAATELAQKRGNDITVHGLYDGSDGVTTFAGVLMEAGIPIINPGSQKRLDDPGAIQALKQVTELARSGGLYVPPQESLGSDNTTTIQQRIREQQIGIWSTDAFRSQQDTQLPFAVGIAPYPALPFFIGSTSAHIMSKGTLRPQESWRWLSFLNDQQNTQLLLQNNEIPARETVAKQSQFWEQRDQETVIAFTTVLSRSFEGTFGTSRIDVANILQEVLYNNESPERALQSAQATIEQQSAIQSKQPSSPQSNESPIIVATPIPMESAREDATTVTFYSFAGSSDDIRRSVEMFNQQNLGVYVEIKPLDPYKPWTLPEVANEVDCFTWFNPPSSSEMTATLDLAPLIDSDATFNIDDYPNIFLTPFQQGQRLHGLPFGVSLRWVLMYNKTLFDAAGLEYPRADWDLDDFQLAAQQLTQGDGDTKQIGFAAKTEGDLEFFINRFGATLITGEERTVTPNYTNPQVQQAVQFYLDLLRHSGPDKYPDDYKFEGDGTTNAIAQLIAEGRVGMWLEYGIDESVMDTDHTQDFTVDIAPPPFGTSPATVNDFWLEGMHIAAQTQHPQACWTWLKYLSKDVSVLGSRFPAQKSLADSELFRQRTSPKATEIYLGYLAALERAPNNVYAINPRNQALVDSFWLHQAADNALQGKSLDVELSTAQERAKQFLICVQDGGKGSDCAKQADPNYGGGYNADL
jgi:multiple sugar transport system substrate-binding protein